MREFFRTDSLVQVFVQLINERVRTAQPTDLG